MRIENILFDLDGTLIDSRGDIVFCLQRTFAEMSLPFKEEDLVIGPPLEDIILLLAPGISNDLQKEAVQVFRKFYMKSKYEKTLVFAGVEATLADLRKKGKRLFIATNKPMRPTINVLETLSFGKFECIGTPDMCEAKGVARMDKADVIASMMKEYQLDKQVSCMVGDTIPDIVAGKKNELKTIAFTGGYGAKEDLEASKADFVIDYFPEILKCII